MIEIVLLLNSQSINSTKRGIPTKYKTNVTSYLKIRFIKLNKIVHIIVDINICDIRLNRQVSRGNLNKLINKANKIRVDGIGK
jgi:hypothetical protein